MKLIGLSAEALERLQALEQEGRLTPNAVREDAAKPESPLHGYFEWDDSVAAGQHRLDQARALIRRVLVVWTTHNLVLTSVYYSRDPDAEADEQGYVAVPKLAEDRELAMRALNKEVQRIEAAIQRARGPAAICGLTDVLESMLADLLKYKDLLAVAA